MLATHSLSCVHVPSQAYYCKAHCKHTAAALGRHGVFVRPQLGLSADLHQQGCAEKRQQSHEEAILCMCNKPASTYHASPHDVSVAQDVSAILANSSVINSTRSIISGAASTAAGAVTAATGLLSNASTALTAAANSTAQNATNSTATAGGTESDTVLSSQVLNSSTADAAVHSGVQKVTGVLNGVKSWLNSNKTNDAQGEAPSLLPSIAEGLIDLPTCTATMRCRLI